MLEGLEVSEIKRTDFLNDNNDFRLDSEYFLKSYIKLLHDIDNIGYKRISEFSYVTDGIHTSIDYSESSGINLISATSPRENYFDISRNAFISEDAHKKNPRTALKENDIVLSTVGTIGNCAVVRKTILPANSDRHVGIIRIIDGFLPNFVSTFLLTKYGRFQTWRESTGNVQLNLFLYKIRTLKIANLSVDFQNVINEIVEKAHSNRIFSQNKYSQAETLLLETLGLWDFEINSDAVNVKGFKESFLSTGRLDAEYYQPKYEQIINAIKSCQAGCDKLENFIFDYSTGFPFKSESYTDFGIPLIRINNIQNGELDISNAVCLPFEDELLSPKDIAQENDILISMSGTVGSSCKIPVGTRALINQRIMRITTKNYNAEILPLIINSIIGRYQLERIGTGGVQTNISATDIKQILIPILDKDTQHQISSLIQESFRLKKESEQLLDLAKRAVEIAIEEGEERAMEVIENHK